MYISILAMLIITVISPRGVLNYTITASSIKTRRKRSRNGDAFLYVPNKTEASREDIFKGFDSSDITLVSAVLSENIWNGDFVLFVSILLCSFASTRIFCCLICISFYDDNNNYKKTHYHGKRTPNDNFL